jgi:signal transduction histidine kinase
LEEVLTDLNEIKAASRRLQRMSTEILEYARGGGALSKKLTPAGKYLSSVFRGLEVHLAGQGIASSVEFEIEEDAQILVDQDRFQRVFENLIFNARDALLEHVGDKEVSIQAARRKGALEVRIADTGPGISPDIADRLFEPFASKKKRGTGLGLATVRNLVKAHGGEVRVEPKAPEGGAAFTVVIPLGAENSNLRLVEEARPVQL